MAEKLTDIELDSVQLHETNPRSMNRILSSSWQEDDVETAVGLVHVAIQGDRSKKPLLTYHDIGLNSSTCFQGFFNYADLQPILRHFCVYHVNAPGQQDGALPLPQGYQYPSMDQLAEMLLPVLQYYDIKSFVGFGVGAGANILARFGLNHPDKVDGLCLINCTSNKAGWGEWGYQKWNSWYLKSGNLTAGVQEYLLWHFFGTKTMGENYDLMTTFAENIKAINPQNLSHFIDSYVRRTDLGIVREIGLVKKHPNTFKCPVMLVAGDYSPHLDDTITMNSRLDPANSTWMKFECGGMVHEEAPNKLCDAFRLFLQGMGYVPTLSKLNLAQSRLSVASNANLLHHHHHHSPVKDTKSEAMKQEAVC